MKVTIVGVNGDSIAKELIARLELAPEQNECEYHAYETDAEAKEAATKLAGRPTRGTVYFIGDEPSEGKAWPRERYGGAKFFASVLDKAGVPTEDQAEQERRDKTGQDTAIKERDARIAELEEQVANAKNENNRLRRVTDGSERQFNTAFRALDRTVTLAHRIESRAEMAVELLNRDVSDVAVSEIEHALREVQALAGVTRIMRTEAAVFLNQAQAAPVAEAE